MKTAELTGALLDYWVAKAEGLKVSGLPVVEIRGSRGWLAYRPSTDWAQGGPIIERAMITVTPQAYDVGPATCSGWIAVQVIYGLFEDDNGRRSASRFFDKNYLAAAMRAVVHAKFGDEVPNEI